jgi:uncharacterized membrane protein (UPF0127 family)
MRRALFILFLACHTQAAPKPEIPMGAVRFETPRGPWVVKVEIANSEETRERGLMFRRDLLQDRGMIFIFPTTAEHGFWMRNTFLALDMIFLGEDRSVLGVVERAEPRTDTVRSVKKPSRYVVEVGAGEAAAHALGPRTRAVFIDIPE